MLLISLNVHYQDELKKTSESFFFLVTCYFLEYPVAVIFNYEDIRSVRRNQSKKLGWFR